MMKKHPLPRSRRHALNLAKIQKTNKILLSTGMTWKNINRFWNDCIDQAKLIPPSHPVREKYEDRMWLRGTRKMLENLGIKNGLIKA